MNHKHHRDKDALSYMRKNAPLMSGLAAVLLTVLFVSTIIFSGKSNQLSMLTNSSAQTALVTTYQEVTCSNAIVSTNMVIPGDLTVGVMNANNQKVAQSGAFRLPYADETTLVQFPQLSASGNYKLVLMQNNQPIGVSLTNSYNLVCPPPTVYFSNHTCSSVDVATSEVLSGQFQVAVLFGSGEQGTPSRVVTKSQPFSFNQYNARAVFQNKLTSNDDFLYVLYRDGAFIGRIGFGSPHALDCYNPTPSDTPQPATPVPGVLSRVNARCTAPDTIEVTWGAHTGADHYAIEGFKESSNGNSSRVYGFTSTRQTRLVAQDPDFLGNRITMDVYAQDASSHNIAGPVFSQQVLCGSGDTPAPTPTPVACSNKDIMLVMDTSGSMSGSKIRDAKAGVKAMIARIPTNAAAQVGVVGFGTHAYSVSDLTENMSKVSSAADKLKASGGTNLAEGISAGTSKFEIADGRTHVTLIMTDGVANLPREKTVGPNDPAAFVTAQAAATQAIATEISKGVQSVFYTVGLGSKSNLNAAWLDTLAKGTGGKSVYISKSADIDNQFTSLVSDMCKETPSNAGTALIRSLQSVAPPKQ